MSKQVELSVILPAYNEARNLAVLLPRLTKTLKQLRVQSEIIVIDTMTPKDNSRSICERYKCIYVNRTSDDSFGSAVRTGLKHTSGKYILFMDADCSHDPEFISKMYPFISSYDIVVASRYIPGGMTDNIPILIFMSKIVNVIFRLVLGIKCMDVSNSFKIYRSGLIKHLELCCNNFDIVEEILFKVLRTNKNIKIKEVAFHFRKRRFGTTKRNLFMFMLTYFYTLIKLKYRQ